MSAATVFKTIGSVLLAILILLIMITIHEFGHYTAGKIFKFGIKEFAIGFGPAIIKKKKKNGEIFSVRVFPLGGFCSFEGEDAEDESPTAFNNQKPWKRIIVLVAGAFMNFVLALVLIIMLFAIYGQSLIAAFEVKQTSDPLYNTENSFVDGDVIVKVDGKNVYLASDLQKYLDEKDKGDEVPFIIVRNGEQIELSILLREDVDIKNSTDLASVYRSLGIATMIVIDEADSESAFKKGDYITRVKTSDYEYAEDGNSAQPYFSEERIYSTQELFEYLATFNGGETAEIWVIREVDGVQNKYPVSITFGADYNEIDKTDMTAVLNYVGLNADNISSYDRITSVDVRLGFGATIGRSFVYSFKIAGTIFKVLGELLTGKLGLNTMGGTVTTIAMTSKIVSYGFNYFLMIAAYIGVNLAVFNLLPIPALDGSRVVFTVIEWIRKKPINRNVEGVIHFVGLILLLGFAVLVDLLQLF